MRANRPQRVARTLLGVMDMLITLSVIVYICQNSIVQFNYVQSINYQFPLAKSLLK